MTTFQQNITVLKEKIPDIEEKIVGRMTGVNIEKEKSRSGKPTVRVIDSKGKVYLHSSYDPEKEAQKWVARIETNSCSTLIVLGNGLGYHLLELIKAIPDGIKLVIVEPVVELFKLALENIDLRPVFARENTFLCLGNDKQDLERAIIRNVQLYNLNRVQIIEYEPVFKVFKDIYLPVQKVIIDQIARLMVTLNTLLNFSQQWPTNFFSNLEHILANPGVNTLFGRFKDVPAIIVSAGPSLNNNVQLLKRARGKSVIICVGTALKVLLKNGIQPDFVISIDGGVNNYRHFEDIEDFRAALIFDITIYPQIVEEYKGKKFVAACDDYLFKWVEKVTGEQKGNLKMGPSVANVSFDFARKIGANPIIFIGQDLAYADGKTHAQGSSWEKMSYDASKGGFLEVKGLHGKTVVTTRALYTFLQWFEKEIKNTKDIEVINATDFGADIPGTQVMDLDTAIDRYCHQTVNVDQIIHEIQEKFRFVSEDKILDLLKVMKQAHENLRKLVKLGNDGYELSRKLESMYQTGLPIQKQLDKLLKKLNKIDKEIKKCQDSFHLLAIIFQPVQMKLNQGGFKESRKGETESEKGQRIAKQSQLLYRGIGDVAEYMEKVVWEAGKRIEESIITGRGEVLFA